MQEGNELIPMATSRLCLIGQILLKPSGQLVGANEEPDTDTRIARLFPDRTSTISNAFTCLQLRCDAKTINRLYHRYAVVQLMAGCLLRTPYYQAPNEYALVPYVPRRNVFAASLQQNCDVPNLCVTLGIRWEVDPNESLRQEGITLF